ncbi:MAG: hypothetical protein WA624_06885 [Methylocella sp.]
MRHLSGAETAETPARSSYHADLHTGGFQMSTGWLDTLRAINGRGRSFDARDMIAAGAALGFEIKTLNARSQLFQYKKKGIIKRVALGKYALTQKGRDMLQKKGNASATTNGQENGGSEAGASGTI